MISKQFVTCWENRHTGETGHGNPTTIEMATAVAAFGDILYPHREHFVEDVELIRFDDVETIYAFEVIRHQVKLFGGGYITKDGKPLRFNNRHDIEIWIQKNQHKYVNRLCDVQILRGE